MRTVCYKKLLSIKEPINILLAMGMFSRNFLFSIIFRMKTLFLAVLQHLSFYVLLAKIANQGNFLMAYFILLSMAE
jgi:hypothetical protein